MKTFNALFSGFVLFLLASCSAPVTENKVEATEPAAAAPVTPAASSAATSYTLQKDASSIVWKGSNKFTPKAHEGTLLFVDGTLGVENDQVVSGKFTANMNSITSAGDQYTNGTEKVGYLVEHLKSADFFDAAVHPTSTFEITAVKPITGSSEYNHEITGNLTIKGISKQITFPANVVLTGPELAATAKFTIDRSQWEVKFGSETFFPDLVKDKLIRNEIELTLNLRAQKAVS